MNHSFKNHHMSSQLSPLAYDTQAVFEVKRPTAREGEDVRMQYQLDDEFGDLIPPSQRHSPVLVRELLSALVCKPNEKAIYLDCTVGMGGHAGEILKATSSDVRVIGVDRDEEAIALSGLHLISFQDRVSLIQGSFKKISELVRNLGISELNGILFDCGVSSMQLTSPQRGFSCTMSGPLDMRMDRSLPQTAADIVNTVREEPLANLIYRYGEERASRRIAAAIVRYRENEGPIIRTDCLSDIVCRIVPRRSKGKRIHPATKTFQALRICVNDELAELEEGLAQAVSLLAVGGRVAVISFHSLEDRIVKQYFKSVTRPAGSTASGFFGAATATVAPVGVFVNLYKKPVIPTAEEIYQNPRARSAKLRVLERVA